ncbi:putative plus-end-directed kinesin ATPase [Helianthus annuus]|nr:putative plus-end-directed kinesin ATPase [Helianthus annuus]KAJ0727381.1 putative plus-end-directed kinesin ATPase [Helianthus annuus]KAJ0730179.1 putative plus-end-directed kinesin ATPase [Helianthus annuus]
MKHSKPSRNQILREIPLDTPPSNPSPIKQPKSSNRKHKFSKENDSPHEIGSVPDSSPSPAAGKLKSPLPPRPPNALKRKLSNDFGVENGVSGSDDTGVKVIVRVRPTSKNEEEGEVIVQKTSGDSLTILGQPFTFDSVADATSTQVDIFSLVGAPLVENCLAGFNSSVFAYGQTGSGKTYTVWGPANALLENELSSDQQGLTPRVFERLFARISEEQNKHADKQLIYQCRCSFLEIYNEQITDLLDPAQRNLQIREDTKTGVYVENLTEESVCSIKDVTQLLKKGLSNRRTGATSINMESSRSHSVFTCVVESRCKSMDGLSSLKTSRINLVDLAGSERQKLTGAAGERLKEAGNINRSLSQLGNLINILAEVSQSGKQRHIPYRDSKLTFLLQESLGGNAKLAMVCAVSPAQSCKSETLSTLRFAQRAKAIKNKAVVNEQMQDDVKSLREVIRQLKDELLRMKSNGNQVDPGTGYSTGWNARRSLNLLKFSLNHHPMMLPRMDDDDHDNHDDDEEMEIVEEAEQVIIAANEACKNMELDTTDADNQEILTHSLDNQTCDQDSLGDTPNLTIVPFEATAVLKSPTASVTPRAINNSRKSSKNSSTLTSSPETNRLAASLINGLEVINKHRQSSVLGRSSFRFSYKSVAPEPKPVKKEIGVQTIFPENEFLCSNCKGKSLVEVNDANEANDDLSLQLVPVDCAPLDDNLSKQIVIPKAVEKVLAGAIRREMALEEFCTRQNAEIMQLNRLVQQYKHERECNSIIGQLQEDKIARLENLMEGVLSAEEFVDDELRSLTYQHEILKEKYENHPEIARKGFELKNVQDELERYKNFFDMGERDVLIEEIQDLRSQLQSYIDCSPKLTKKESPLLQITNGESTFESAEQRFESERIRFSETERKWNSLIKELKSKLEETQLLAEKQKQELDCERKCSEELKEAMQMAMEGHARMLEQYVDLEEKHMNMLINKRMIQDSVEDVKKAAAKAGVRGAESRFINALATEISSLKVEREKERRRFRDEIKGLEEQLSDTIEAVQAAGELVVRLKDAEEAVAAAQARAMEAEQETKNAFKQIEKLKKKQKIEASTTPVYDMPIYDTESNITVDQQPKEEFEQFFNVDKEPTSWFSGYDRCNI